MYLNQATIIGNLTRDPELRSLPSGVQVASFPVATNRIWKNKSGERQEASDFHNIVVFGKQAESVSQYLKKGSSILVQGRIQTRSWDDQTSGTKKYRTEIVAERIQFGPRPNKVEKSEADKQYDSIDQPEAVEVEGVDTSDIPF